MSHQPRPLCWDASEEPAQAGERPGCSVSACIALRQGGCFKRVARGPALCGHVACSSHATQPGRLSRLGCHPIAPHRFGPGGATTGQLKRTGARKPFTPSTASGSSRKKFKAPGKVAGTPGASRLGAGGQAAAAAAASAVHKPAVQLHTLQGSLLRQLLASWPAAAAAAAAEAAHEAAAGEQGAATDAAGPMEAGGAQQQAQQALQTQQLPLDSTVCTAYRVPNQPLPEGNGEAGLGEGAAAATAAARGQQPPAAAQPAAAAAAGQAPQAAPLGWEQIRQRLLEAGANPSYASTAWARNHYRWVRLAAHCLGLPPGCCKQQGTAGCSRVCWWVG